MNKNCFRLVFSRRHNALVVVGENVLSAGKAASGARTSSSVHGAVRSFSLKALLHLMLLATTGQLWLSGFAMAQTAPLASNALPTGGQVVAGHVVTNVSGSTMTINQGGDKAVVNWNSFNVGSAAKVNIVQPGSNAVILNRVVGHDPTQIQGQISANGQVMLVNPNGVVVGKDGSLSASGFTASSYGISDANFLAGKHQFDRNGTTAGVRNDGKIQTTSGGYVALIGAEVMNNGQIIAPQGTVIMAAAESVTVPGEVLQAAGAANTATTDGSNAPSVSVPLSGRVRLSVTAAAINTAVINTKDGVIVTEGGQVLLQAAAVSDAVASVTHSGRIDTSAPQGGAVTVLADKGKIKIDGTIVASSSGKTNGQLNAGGSVVIGRNLDTGVLAAATDASNATIVSERGFVETSGHYLQTENIKVQAAEWSLDPNDIEINATSTAVVAGNSVVLASAINNALNLGTSVTISTGTGAGSTSSATGVTQATAGTGNTSPGTIYLNQGISKTAGGTATLKLLANTDILFSANQKITSTLGALNVVLNSNLQDAVGAVVFNSGSGIISNGGSVTIGGGSAGTGAGYAMGSSAYPSGVLLSGATIAAGGGNIVIQGQGTSLGVDSAGVTIDAASSITTTGAATINIKGKQATGSPGQGIYLAGASTINSETGSITLVGTGGNGYVSGLSTMGVRIDGNSKITTTDASILVTAIGNKGGGLYGFGAYIGGGTTRLSAGGSGNVVVNATGTANGSSDSVGIQILAPGAITTSNGSINVTGTSLGATGNYNSGVAFAGSGSFVVTGTGSVTIVGTAGTVGTSSNGVQGPSITTAGGAISITGASSSTGTGTTGIDMVATSALSSSGGNITLITDSYAGTGTTEVINAGAGIVNFKNRTAGTLINVGGADVLTGSPFTLGLTNAELNRVTADTLKIGSITAGNISVSTAITTAASSGNLFMQSNGTITAANAVTSGSGLYMQTQGGAISNTAALSGTNVSLDNSGGTIWTATGLIEAGSFKATGVDGITIGGAVTASNVLNMYGTGDRSGIKITQNITAATIEGTGKSSGVSGTNAGVAWTTGAIATTGLTNSNLHAIGTNLNGGGTGAFNIYGNVSVSSVLGGTLTLYGEAPTSGTGNITNTRGFRSDTGTTLTTAGNIYIEGSSNNNGGVVLLGNVVANGVGGVASNLSINGTTETTGTTSWGLGGVGTGGTITLNNASNLYISGGSNTKTTTSMTYQEMGVSVGGQITGSGGAISIKGYTSTTAASTAAPTLAEIAVKVASSISSGSGKVTIEGQNMSNATSPTIAIGASVSAGTSDLLIQSVGGGVSQTAGTLTGKNVTIDNTGAGMTSVLADANASPSALTVGMAMGGSINSTTGAITAGSGVSKNTNAISFAGAGIQSTGNINILADVVSPTLTGIVTASTATLRSSLQNAISNYVTNGSIVNNGTLEMQYGGGQGGIINVSATTGSVTGTGSIGSATNLLSTVTVTNGLDSIYDGQINGQIVNKEGTALLTVRNKLYAFSQLNVNHGSLQIGDGTAATTPLPMSLETRVANIASGSTLTFKRAESYTNNASFTGAGSLVQAGAGTLTLTGNSSAFSGATTVNAGTSLAIGTGPGWSGYSASTGAAASGNLGAANSTVTLASSTSSLIFTNTSGTSTVGSNILGAGTVSQTGAGTGILTGTNTYSGVTTISAGTLQIGNGGTTGTLGTGSVTDNTGTLAFKHSDNIVVSNLISGSGSLAQIGTGTTTLTANNTYAGTTTISAGTLQVGNGGATGTLGAGDVTLSNNAALKYVRSAATTVANNISGAGNVSATITGASSTLTIDHTINLTNGTINLVTDGNLSLTNALSTTNATTSAIFLEAGKATAAGVATGGDVTFSGAGAVTAASGRITIETGSIAGSTGLGAPVGNNRYNSDEVTTNYSLALGTTGEYVIYREKPLLNVQVNDVVKTYNGVAYTGGSLSTTLLSGSLVNGDSLAIVTGNKTFGGTAQSVVNATTTPLVISASETSNALGYGVTYTSGALTVNKADLVATGTMVYGATTSFAGSSFTSIAGVNGETFTASGSGVLSTANVQTSQNLSSVGTLTLTGVSGASTSNYNALTTAQTSVSVTPRALTITGANNNSTYTGVAQTNTGATITGNQGSDTFAIAGYGSGTNASTTAYADNLSVTATGATSLGNYSVTYVNGGLTIGKANLSASGSMVYDATTGFAGSKLTSITGVNGETFTASGAGVLSTANVQTGQNLSSLGTLSLSGNSGALTSNYNALTTAQTSVSVTQRALTITGANNNSTYTGVTQTNTGATIAGNQGSDTFAIAGYGSGTNASTTAYADTLSVTATGATSLGNYSVTYVNGGLTIGKANLSASGSMIYDATTSFAGSNLTSITGVNGETFTASGAGVLSTANVQTNQNLSGVGTLTLTGVNGASTSNYNALTTAQTSVSVTPRALTVIGTNASVTYNGNTQTNTPANLSGVQGLDSFTVNGYGSGKNASTTAYADNLSLAANGSTLLTNYSVTYTNGALTVGKANLTATGSMVYDSTTAFSGSNLTSITGVNGETFTATGSGTLASANVQMNQNLLSASGLTLAGVATALASNYNTLSAAQTSVSVTPRSLTVTGANNSSTYNGLTQTNSGAVIVGQQGSDAFTVNGYGSGQNASATAYADNLSLSGNGSTLLSNYSVTYANGGLTIGQATLTATLAGVSKVYDGTTAATLTNANYNLQGFMQSEGATITQAMGSYQSKDVSSNNGTGLVSTTLTNANYVANAGTILSNYVLATSAQGNVGTITPAALTVKVNDASTFVTLDPTAATSGSYYSYTGLKNGESAAQALVSVPGMNDRTYTGSANPVAGTYVNAYSLNATPVATNGNYTVAVQNGTLTVVPAGTLLISIAGESINYGTVSAVNAGSTAQTVTAKYLDLNGGLINTLTTTNLGSGNWRATDSTGTSVTFSATALNTTASSGGYLNVGNYNFDATPIVPNVTPNFTASVVNGGVLAVTPIALTAGTLNLTKQYDGTASVTGVALTPSGVLTGDQVSATASNGAFATPNAGTNISYTLTGLFLSGQDAANYSAPVSVTGAGKITPKQLTLTGVSVADKVYDGTTNATVSSNGVLAGLVGTEKLTYSTTALFSNKNAGTNKAVTLDTLLGNGVGGLASNYTLAPVAATTATVTPKIINASYSGQDKKYDGSTSATVTGSLSGLIAGDQVSLTNGTANFDSPVAGTNKLINVGLLGLDGLDAGNYSLSSYSALVYASIMALPTVPETKPNQTVSIGSASNVTPSRPSIQVATSSASQGSVKSSSVSSLGRSSQFGLAAAEERSICTSQALENCTCEEDASNQDTAGDALSICYEPVKRTVSPANVSLK